MIITPALVVSNKIINIYDGVMCAPALQPYVGGSSVQRVLHFFLSLSASSFCFELGALFPSSAATSSQSVHSAGLLLIETCCFLLFPPFCSTDGELSTPRILRTA